MMEKFSDLRSSLREWLTSFRWIQLIMPYQMYLLLGGLGLMFLDALFRSFRVYIHFFGLLSDIGFWLFLLGALLTLIGSNVKYLPYALWGYVFVDLFPFRSFGFSTLLEVIIVAALGFLLLKYTATENTVEA